MDLREHGPDRGADRPGPGLQHRAEGAQIAAAGVDLGADVVGEALLGADALRQPRREAAAAQNVVHQQQGEPVRVAAVDAELPQHHRRLRQRPPDQEHPRLILPRGPRKLPLLARDRRHIDRRPAGEDVLQPRDHRLLPEVAHDGQPQVIRTVVLPVQRDQLVPRDALDLGDGGKAGGSLRANVAGTAVYFAEKRMRMNINAQIAHLHASILKYREGEARRLGLLLGYELAGEQIDIRDRPARRR